MMRLGLVMSGVVEVPAAVTAPIAQDRRKVGELLL
jgi:hypothetical protein